MDMKNQDSKSLAPSQQRQATASMLDSLGGAPSAKKVDPEEAKRYLSPEELALPVEKQIELISAAKAKEATGADEEYGIAQPRYQW